MGKIYITTGVRYGNVQQQANFTRNNCGAGFTGSTVTYTVAANTYFSDASQLVANQQAIDDINTNGQAFANSTGTCTENTRYYNTEQHADFTRNNCGGGYYSNPVTYSVPAGTFYTYTSVSDANDLAIASIATNGQTYANANGICIPSATYANVEKHQTFTKNDCGEGTVGTDVVYSVPAGTYTSGVDQTTADNLALADISANGQTYANTHGNCTAIMIGNEVQSQAFTRNNCSTDYSGSSVTYTVTANTYYGADQTAANNLALADIASNGQAYANANGSCTQTTFWNTTQSGSYQKNDCPTDFTGSFVTYTVAAHTYSAGSLSGANALAAADISANAQAYANANGSCTRTTFWNELQSGEFQKNDCTGSTTGSIEVYSIAAHTYSSSTSVEAANATAAAAVTSGGQAYANSNGVCLPNDIVNVFTVDFGGSLSYDLCMYIDTPGVSQSGNIVARDGLNFYPIGSSPASAFMLASDNFNSSGITRRFEGSIGKLEALYPDATAIPQFIFKIRGRAASSVSANIRWVKKGANQGKMTMTGSPGSYIPSVDNPSNNGIIDITKAVTGGGDGTIGVGIGSVIMTLTYTRSTKSLVVT